MRPDNGASKSHHFEIHMIIPSRRRGVLFTKPADAKPALRPGDWVSKAYDPRSLTLNSLDASINAALELGPFQLTTL